MRPILFLSAVLLLLVAAWTAGVPELLSWNSLAAHREYWQDWADQYPVASALIYVTAYTTVVAASIPAGGILTLAGGLLFGAVAGAALAVIGASLGAIALFLLARGTLGAVFAKRVEPLLEKVRPALERDGFWGLLALRLIPIVPFWLGNLAPALLGMRLLPFAAATVIGIVPATAVLAWLGAGVGDVLAAGRQPDLSLLTSSSVLGPLLGMAALSLLPIAMRRWRSRHGTA